MVWFSVSMDTVYRWCVNTNNEYRLIIINLTSYQIRNLKKKLVFLMHSSMWNTQLNRHDSRFGKKNIYRSIFLQNASVRLGLKYAAYSTFHSKSYSLQAQKFIGEFHSLATPPPNEPRCYFSHSFQPNPMVVCTLPCNG